jgi:hypothetical protein
MQNDGGALDFRDISSQVLHASLITGTFGKTNSL